MIVLHCFSCWNVIFSSAGWVRHMTWSKCCLSVCMWCLGVNQGGTNHNRCTQRFVTLHMQTYWWTLVTHQKLVRFGPRWWPVMLLVLNSKLMEHSRCDMRPTSQFSPLPQHSVNFENVLCVITQHQLQFVKSQSKIANVLYARTTVCVLYSRFYGTLKYFQDMA